MKIEIVLTKKKTTASTVVYENRDKGFPGIYLPKWMFSGHPPEKLKLTVEDERGMGEVEIVFPKGM